MQFEIWEHSNSVPALISSLRFVRRHKGQSANVTSLRKLSITDVLMCYNVMEVTMEWGVRIISKFTIEAAQRRVKNLPFSLARA